MAVIKTRATPHGPSVRLFSISSGGIVLDEPLPVREDSLGTDGTLTEVT